ncbi:MAG: hypothetical protein FWG09_06850 [Synergistaceae bacterium]|nr:hypothetical protein [Synergistaceae bacterium]
MFQFDMLGNEQKDTIIKAIGIGKTGEAALDRAAGGEERTVEILTGSADSGLKSAQENLAGTDLLLLAVDADNKEDVDSACVMIKAAKAEKNLVFSFALSSVESQKDGTEGIACLEAETDALFIVPKNSGDPAGNDVFADALRAMLQFMKLFSPGSGAIIPVNFEDFKKLFANAGRSFFGVGMSKGDECSVLAAREAIGKPIATAGSPNPKFSKAAVHMETGDSATMFDMQKAIDVIAAVSVKDPEVIWGNSVSPDMADAFRVIVLAV